MEKLSFGKRLKLKRQAKRLTQEELAFAIGKSHRTTISSYELDKGQPTIEEAKKLAEILDTSVSYLVDGDPEKEGYVVVPRDEWNERNLELLRAQKELLVYKNKELAGNK